LDVLPRPLEPRAADEAAEEEEDEDDDEDEEEEEEEDESLLAEVRDGAADLDAAADAEAAFGFLLPLAPSGCESAARLTPRLSSSLNRNNNKHSRITA
jgi:hypothetical protein